MRISGVTFTMKIAHEKMKGISPLLASIFLVLIAATVVPIFSGWFMDNLMSAADASGNRTEEAVKCNAAGLAIEDFYLDFSAGRARVNVRNSGQARSEEHTSELQSQFHLV